MGSYGGHLEVLYTFTQTNAGGQNRDGAECYEILIELSGRNKWQWPRIPLFKRLIRRIGSKFRCSINTEWRALYN